MVVVVMMMMTMMMMTMMMEVTMVMIFMVVVMMMMTMMMTMMMMMMRRMRRRKKMLRTYIYRSQHHLDAAEEWLLSACCRNMGLSLPLQNRQKGAHTSLEDKDIIVRIYCSTYGAQV